MKKHWVHIIGVLLLVSCGREIIPRPANLVAKDKMIKIIEEMAVVNAAKSNNSSILVEHDIDPTKFVLKKYDVDSLQFVESDLYYVSKPAIYKEMFESVQKRLETKAKEMGEAKRIKDSISLAQQKLKMAERSKPLNSATDSLP